MKNLLATKGRKALAGSALVVAAITGVTGPADAASISFSTWTSNGTAFASGTVYSGQARVRADCAYAVDQYSAWVGRGYHYLAAGKCPFGIRGAIMEMRY